MTTKEFNKIEIEDLSYIGYTKNLDTTKHYLFNNKTGKSILFEIKSFFYDSFLEKIITKFKNLL